jgi:CDP-diacylglycerol---glycerol-3-phosphate 3-phosphatidyltransferase
VTVNAPPVATGNDQDDRGRSWKDRARDFAHAALAPVVGGMYAIGLRADHLTLLGLVISIGAGLAFFEGGFRRGALLTAVAGVCDILDGQLARRAGGSSRFGAFLDSTLDRLADAIVLAGIAAFYLSNLVELSYDPSRVVAEIARGLEPRTWAVVALTAVLAIIGSFLVSYTRARAEGLGLECKVGWFERPERTVLLIVAGAFGVGPVMPGALLLLVLLSFATAAQRVAHVWKITRGAGLDR